MFFKRSEEFEEMHGACSLSISLGYGMKTEHLLCLHAPCCLLHTIGQLLVAQMLGDAYLAYNTDDRRWVVQAGSGVGVVPKGPYSYSWSYRLAYI